VGSTTGERFEKALEAIRENIGRAGEKADKGEDDAKEREIIKSKRTEIESADSEFRKEFAATEKKLKDAKLPQEILDRHYKFVKHYDDNVKELKTNLDDVDKARTSVVRPTLLYIWRP
jgi:vacuolar-type H+-ATPase subunit E/Vma4